MGSTDTVPEGGVLYFAVLLTAVPAVNWFESAKRSDSRKYVCVSRRGVLTAPPPPPFPLYLRQHGTAWGYEFYHLLQMLSLARPGCIDRLRDIISTRAIM